MIDIIQIHKKNEIFILLLTHLPLDEMAAILPDDIFKYIFLK